jgi:hypothetical protein
LQVPVTIHGRSFPRGTTFLLNGYWPGRDPERVPEPDAFKPERWLPEAEVRPMGGMGVEKEPTSIDPEGDLFRSLPTETSIYCQAFGLERQLPTVRALGRGHCSCRAM